ncbi:MAG: YebC/PmpR family DNA-binding transcriptional regulator [Planctomycetes bacterium]|nr:YebC/PmpR family DNA-binding transcriptional regulator [Planctomycetota bacterium]
MSGHSKWHQIRHKKARSDKKRAKEWSILARNIIMAARSGGGDAKMNYKLAFAIEEAKAANMPGGNVDRAIKRGTGELEGADPEELTYEGYGHGGAALLVECLTDNRARTAPAVKHAFEKNGGRIATPGSVTRLFERQGLILIEKDKAPEDKLFDIVVDAGAEDLDSSGEYYAIKMPAAAFEGVKKALREKKIKTESAELVQVPHATVALNEEDGRKLLKIIEVLEDLEDVQNVFGNYEMPDSLMAELEKK